MKEGIKKGPGIKNKENGRMPKGLKTSFLTSPTFKEGKPL